MTCESNALTRQIWTAAGSMIVTLLIQSAAAMFWAGAISARVANIEAVQVRCEERVHRLEVLRGPIAEANH